MIELAITNDSTVLTDAQVENAVPAFQTQITHDFSPVWGTDASVKFYPKGATIPETSWRVSLADDSDQAGALGYHLTQQGMPFGFVFCKSDIAAGLSWTVTASHEILELLADPYVFSTIDVPNSGHGGTLLPQEVADAPEADNFGYSKPGADGKPVMLSDWVTPAWFGATVPPKGFPGCKGAYDFMGHCTVPFQILAGGYIGVKNYRRAGQWGQVTGQQDPTAGELKIVKADGTIMQPKEIPTFSRRNRRAALIEAAKTKVMPTSSLLGGVQTTAFDAAPVPSTMPILTAIEQMLNNLLKITEGVASMVGTDEPEPASPVVTPATPTQVPTP